MCALPDQPGEESVGLLGFGFPQKKFRPQESAAVPGKETLPGDTLTRDPSPLGPEGILGSPQGSWLCSQV